MRAVVLPSLGLLALGAVATACSESTVTGVPSEQVAVKRAGSPPSGGTSPAGESCVLMDFNQFRHGDRVSTVSLPAFGLTLTVSTNPYAAPPGMVTSTFRVPRAFDGTITGNNWEDTDLMGIGSGVWRDPDTGELKPGRCPGCPAQGRFLVIEDERGFAPWGDYRWGGLINFAGFSGNVYLKSYVAIDDDHGEPSIDAYVDGRLVGRSTGRGDGSVEHVATTAQPPITRSLQFEFGTVASDFVTGSGAIDDLQFCRQVTNPGTGTPGYWKNHPGAWPTEVIVVGGVTYTKQQAIAIMNTAPRGDKTYNMFAQLVSAMLNVMIGNDPSCIAATIEAADAWMRDHPPGSGVSASSAAWKVGEPLHERLDAYNNGKLCAPSRG